MVRQPGALQERDAATGSKLEAQTEAVFPRPRGLSQGAGAGATRRHGPCGPGWSEAEQEEREPHCPLPAVTNLPHPHRWLPWVKPSPRPADPKVWKMLPAGVSPLASRPGKGKPWSWANRIQAGAVSNLLSYCQQMVSNGGGVVPACLAGERWVLNLVLICIISLGVKRSTFSHEAHAWSSSTLIGEGETSKVIHFMGHRWSIREHRADSQTEH